MPKCPHCNREMQPNTAINLPTVQQYLCSCKGTVIYKNEPRWSPPLELRQGRK